MTSNSGSGAATLGEMIASPPAPPVVVQPAAPVAPTNSAEATARFNDLQRDAGWRDRLLAGNGPEAKEYRQLRTMIDKGSPVDKAMAGILDDAPFQQSGHLQNIAATQLFRDLGIRDEVIRQTLEGHEVTQRERDAVSKWKADRMRDPDWTAKYLSADGEARRDMLLANIVLSSPVKKVA